MLKWIKIRRNSQKADGVLHKTTDARWKSRGGNPAELRKNRSGCRVDMRPAAQNRLRAGTERGIMKKTIEEGFDVYVQPF
ncbi:hypothetical protein [uncultured Dysosmobacter sp.]|uniref:hypothetical protein n=1 Tax=uncultured Dysosmobacter sp. TaxID=2591384 RepID=UPI0026713865|nr:hypothetical protein [uncultured Dysosmobacter sp.]